MRQHSRSFLVLCLAIVIGLLVPVTARAFIGTMPVIDWTAVVRIGRQIGISQETLNTLGLLEASRAEMVSQQEELDANDIESRAAMVSPGGAAKLSAAANGAMLRSQAYDQRLLARLMRLQALKIARENSIEKEQEQIREDQVTAVSNLVGNMKLSYGIGDRRGQ